MERVRSYVSRAKKASSNRFAEYAYKPKKEAPFGLQTNTSAVLGEILQADSSLKESVTGLMAQAKATSTMENYERVTNRLQTSEFGNIIITQKTSVEWKCYLFLSEIKGTRS